MTGTSNEECTLIKKMKEIVEKFESFGNRINSECEMLESELQKLDSHINFVISQKGVKGSSDIKPLDIDCFKQAFSLLVKPFVSMQEKLEA